VTTQSKLLNNYNKPNKYINFTKFAKYINLFSSSTEDELKRQIKRELKSDYDEETIKGILGSVRLAGSNMIYRVDLEKFLFFSEYREKLISLENKAKQKVESKKQTPNIQENNQTKENIEKNKENKDRSQLLDKPDKVDKFDLSDLKQYWVNKFFQTCQAINQPLDNLLKSCTIVYGKGSFINVILDKNEYVSLEKLRKILEAKLPSTKTNITEINYMIESLDLNKTKLVLVEDFKHLVDILDGDVIANNFTLNSNNSPVLSKLYSIICLYDLLYIIYDLLLTYHNYRRREKFNVEK